MGPADVTSNGHLPDVVFIDPQHPPRHTAREMQMVEAELGKSIADLTAGQGEQVMVFFHLRRLGYDPTFEQAADVLVDQAEPDPTSGPSEPAASSTSPGSAGTGV